ncbi:MAG: ferrous iron transport protein B, partial [Pseudomonadota bacterium]
TGAYAVVSNYPGTTVEITQGRADLGGKVFWEVYDTPGMYSLLPVTEEEKVARDMLLGEPPDLVLNVVDAKNLDRMLPLTLQLMEAGLPLVLQLNMLNEAGERGMDIDVAALERELGLPVVATALEAGRGLTELKAALAQRGLSRVKGFFQYSRPLEGFISRARGLLPEGFFSAVAPRAAALLLLQADARILHEVEAAGQAEAARALIFEATRFFGRPLAYAVAIERRRLAEGIVTKVVSQRPAAASGPRERLSLILINPWTGLPILAAVLYFGLYRFVAGFGAGVMVDLLEQHIFVRWLNPWVAALAASTIPWAAGRELVAGEYGLITMGLRYAVAIILPLVTVFFLFFSLLEDSGYLPRLSMLMDRVFKGIGLSGRAVIPMVMGLGCDTMATVVTRTLPTRRERLISTLLLSLAIPCSAQLGVIVSLMSGSLLALTIWGGTITAVFLLVGTVVARLLPGEKPSFYMELPPLRLPSPRNVLLKTLMRMVWYLKEIAPIFVAISALIWLGRITGVFDVLLRALRPPLALLGLPPEAAPAFLFGFFRRDYGATGLYDLHSRGFLGAEQMVVAAVTMTLFLPCVAQFMAMIKEQGLKAGLAVGAFVLVFSFATGLVLHLALTALGVFAA